MIQLRNPYGSGVLTVADEQAAARYVAAGWAPVGASSAARPAGNASREKWAAYAATLGLEVGEDMTRDQIKEAVSAHAE